MPVLEGFEKVRPGVHPSRNDDALCPRMAITSGCDIDPKIKQPYAFSMADDAPFAFAGLWDAWKEPGGDWLQSYSLITTDANELAAEVITECR